MSLKIPDMILEQLEQAIVSTMIQTKAPGCSIAIVANDEIVYSKGFGAKNLEQNLPATPNTLYAFGSNTKSYTALAIMQLVGEGKLNLEDPINKHLPIKLGSKKNPITIHHLLSHSSGITSLGYGDEVIACRREHLDEYWIPMSSWDDFFLFVNGASREVVAEPGVRFAYLNEGYALLQAVVEKVSKMKYADYMKTRILKPLKMHRTTFLKEEFEKDSDISSAYYGEMKNGVVTEVLKKVHLFDELAYGAGGLMSSVVEQTNYLRMNMNGGVFDGTRIIDAALLEEAHKIHIETELVRERLGDLAKEGYGYGWVIMEDFLNHKVVVHSGNTMVAGATLFFVPEKKIGIAMASNTNRGSALLIGLPIIIIATLLGKNPRKDIPFLALDEKLKQLTGYYETYKGIHKMTVVNRGGLLYIEAEDRRISFGGIPQGMSMPLIPATNNLEDLKFYMINGPSARSTIEFNVDSKRNVNLYIAEWCFHKVRDL